MPARFFFFHPKANSYRVALVALSLYVPFGDVLAQDNLDRRVLLTNDSSHAILSFYASNIGSKAWEEDILGVDVLNPDQSTVININDGTGHCMFDFKAVLMNGSAFVRPNVDVCKIFSGTYTD